MKYTFKPHKEWLKGDDGNAWLVDGLVHDGATLWTAKRGVGKSLLSVDLAVAVAKGEREWLGRKVEQGAGPVAMFVSDPTAERETGRRLDALGVQDGQVLVGRMRRGPEPVEEWTRLGDELAGLGTRLVIVDSGTNLVNDINKPEFVNPLLDGLDELVAADLPVLLIHHSPRSHGASAGYYGWEAWPRWWAYLTACGENYRTLACEGNEITEQPTTLVLRMPRKDHPASRFSLADRSQGPEERSAEGEAEDDRRLRRMIEGQPWTSQAEIARTLEVSQPTVSRVLRVKGFALDKATGRLEPAASGDRAGV